MSIRFGKLETLKISGYRSISSTSVDFRNINVIVGQNGAGKSNFVSIFRFLSQIFREELQNSIIKQGGLAKLLHFGPQTTRKLEVYFRLALLEYQVTLEPAPEGSLIILDEWYAIADHKRSLVVPWQTETQLGRSLRLAEIAPIIMRLLESWRVYHFHDTSENAPLRSSANLIEPERLQADGRNLPAFLYYLQERFPEVLQRVLDTVRQVAPFIGTFVLRPEALNPNLIRLRWRHVGHDELFDVNDLSDGTLRFIALTALLLQPEPPWTIVLDEPELGLHPAAITQLGAVIHQVSSEVQIIAATQSPTFVNQFTWEDMIVVDRKDDASTFCRLTEEDVKPWMDDFSMGEIWEKNIIGGRP
jgi:predicted ATPase